MDFPFILIHIAKAAEEVATSNPNPSVVGMFGLDWKSFIAQLVNFSIVLFVLWRYVFKPVTNGLTARTEKIEQSLADVEKINEDKETFDLWKKNEMNNVRQEAAAIIAQTKSESEELRNILSEKTKAEQNRIISQAQATIEIEKNKAIQEIKGEIATMVVHATQVILNEKLDPQKDKELIKQALRKVNI